MSKKLIIIISSTLIVSAGAAVFLFRDDAEAYDYVKAGRGDITEEVNVTGRVKASSEIELGFETSGKVSKIYVDVGEEVAKGALLARAGSTETNIRIIGAEQRLKAAELELQLAEEGASSEDVDLKTSALDTAEQSLEDTLESAQTRLDNAYEDAPVLLSSSYLTLFDTLDVVEDMVDIYFTNFLTSDARTVKKARDEIKTSVDVVKTWRNTLRDDYSTDNAAEALPLAEEELESVSANLDVIIDIMEDWDAVSDSNLTLIKQEKTSVNAKLSEIISTNTSIASIESQNAAEINAAEGAVEQAEKDLSALTADAREQDVDIIETRINQARKEIDLLSSQLGAIFSPISGTITGVDREIGEAASPGTPVISLVSGGLQMEANLPEADVAKVGIGDEAAVTLDAYDRDVIFDASVVKIDPAATILEGVATYKVTLQFSEQDDRIKPGMTANIDILTARSENALIVPQRAVVRRDNEENVRVLEGEEIVEKRVETGLRGIEGNIEIISGLQDGDKVITLIRD